MSTRALNHPLDDICESELARLARVADPLLAGRPLVSAGHRPNRMRAGHGYEFLDYQNYVAGEDLRNIDWRATARSRHPQLRRFRDEQTSDWHICLDCSASMTVMDDRKWRLAVQVTAALSYLLLHIGHRVTLLGFSERCTVLLPSGRGRHHYARLARILRDTAPVRNGGGSDLLQCALRMPPRQQVIIVSDFLMRGEMQPALRRMLTTGRNLQLMHIFDEAEFDLSPMANPVELLDVESLEQRPVTLTKDVMQSARQALHTLRDDLSRFCARQGIRYSAYSTSEDWKTIVIRYIKSFQADHA
jgi:uncharacterized protein (DUF58 family)